MSGIRSKSSGGVLRSAVQLRGSEKNTPDPSETGEDESSPQGSFARQRSRREEVSVEAEKAEKREEQHHLWVSENEPQLKEKREYALDNTLSETFPCSDPLSSIPNPTSCLFDMGER
jgi:hypothetical protein